MPEFTEVVERRFKISGMPRLRSANTSGLTRIRGGSGDEVVVRATKRVHAQSAARARRLLENVEVEIEQEGDEVRVAHRAYLVERGWVGLWRERRAVIDYDVELPAEADVIARATSGEVELRATTGPAELQTVSGDINVADAIGPLRLHTVSGDCATSGWAGALDANSVSGDLRFERCALASARVKTVSGDVEAVARLDGPGPFRITTVSGDVELATPSALELRLHTVSGEIRANGDVRVERASRREFVARRGEGGPRVEVQTVSGDVHVEPRELEAPSPPEPAAASAEPPRERKAQAMEILERLRRGEIDLDQAGRLLDEVR